jgi:hypothetical protein
MATVQLDNGAILELQDGEEVIYTHSRISRKEGFMKMLVYIFVITTKRIALVPDPKWNKKTQGVQTINYADIYYAQHGKSTAKYSSFAYFDIKMNEKRKLLGFIPVHIKQQFLISAGVKESFSLLGKEMKSELKDMAMNMAQAMESSHVDLTAKTQSEYDEKQAEIAKEWAKIRDRAAASDAAADKKAKLTPNDRAGIIIGLVNEARKLALA